MKLISKVKRIEDIDFVNVEFVYSQYEKVDFIKVSNKFFGTTSIPDGWERIYNRSMDDDYVYLVCKDCAQEIKVIGDIIE